MQQASAGAGAEVLDVDNVFNTQLWNGTNASQTITNGIDLTEGGLIWTKARTSDPTEQDHQLLDTEQGAFRYVLESNTTNARFDFGASMITPNTNGFTLTSSSRVNQNTYPYVGWTFRKAPKFFDVVTWTGDGSSNRSISHSLGSVPGFIIIKDTTNINHWFCWHNYFSSLSSGSGYIMLNQTNAAVNTTGVIDTVTSTSFNVTGGATNASGATIIAYVFAHNNSDGEFGPDSDQDVIKCGSFSTDSSGDASVTLGFEPQWLMIKRYDGTSNWTLMDIMRGYNDSFWNPLYADATNAESGFAATRGFPTSTGFEFDGQLSASANYIYMAVRRGPLAEPESASDVFAISTFGQGGSSAPAYTSNFPVDMYFERPINTSFHTAISSRLTAPKYMKTNTNGTEVTDSGLKYDFMDGVYNSTGTLTNYYAWMWKRAPSYFDVLHYSGNGTEPDTRSLSHNLGVTPEMCWIKCRTTTEKWMVWHKDLTQFTSGGKTYGNSLTLNDTTAVDGTGIINVSDTNATTLKLGFRSSNNTSGEDYIAYLFATLAGVSKVGSFTGAGSDVTVDCGFSNGAKFVIIKDTNASDDWYVYDTARGIVAGNDGYLELNTTNAENTGADYIDPHSSGFIITSGFMQSGRTYIFYAIAA